MEIEEMRDTFIRAHYGARQQQQDEELATTMESVRQQEFEAFGSHETDYDGNYGGDLGVPPFSPGVMTPAAMAAMANSPCPPQSETGPGSMRAAASRQAAWSRSFKAADTDGDGGGF